MKFGHLELNPAVNPGVLATATWDPAAAWQALENASLDWAALLPEGAALPSKGGLQLHRGSVARTAQGLHLLATLPDGQDLFLRLGPAGKSVLGEPLGRKPLPGGSELWAFPTDAAVIDLYTREVLPEKGSRALGFTPRLGIGTRMTTAVWPGIFQAMDRFGFASNALQNSIRELSLLDDLLAGAPPHTSYSTGIGPVECGWTGSTYEGLWVAGVLAALKWDGPLRYGADADHVQVKRGPDGVERAKRVIRAARYYSFYTLDVADVLNYAALDEPSAEVAKGFLTAKIEDAREREEITEFHTRPFTVRGRTFQMDAAAAGRFVGKYWEMFEVLAELAETIAGLKEGTPFDLELTIDEHPPEVEAFDCLTTDEEVLFLCREIQRRELPITHLAPNFGQEKGYDYRCPDGLEGLEKRVRAQFLIASEFGLMLDVHSGDDLTQEPRLVFHRATGGQLHFKVSPQLHLIYAEVLQEYHPELFEEWFADATAYATREAANGSPIAQHCMEALAKDPKPSWRQPVFHYFGFPFVGKRDADGQFIRRDRFYQLSDAFYQAHTKRIVEYLGGLAKDLF